MILIAIFLIAGGTKVTSAAPGADQKIITVSTNWREKVMAGCGVEGWDEMRDSSFGKEWTQNVPPLRTEKS